MQTEHRNQMRPFLALLDRLDSEELFLWEHQVRELTDHPGWEVLQTLVGATVEAANARLKYGPVLEQAQYAKELGLVTGLEALSTVADAVFLKAEEVHRELEARAGDPVPA